MLFCPARWSCLCRIFSGVHSLANLVESDVLCVHYGGREFIPNSNQKYIPRNIWPASDVTLLTWFLSTDSVWGSSDSNCFFLLDDLSLLPTCACCPVKKQRETSWLDDLMTSCRDIGSLLNYLQGVLLKKQKTKPNKQKNNNMILAW